jgi:hypothetical protein
LKKEELHPYKRRHFLNKHLKQKIYLIHGNQRKKKLN